MLRRVYISQTVITYTYKFSYHRVNGPAMMWVHGTHMWYYHGKIHRKNDPAIIDSHGYKEWWVNGRRIKVTILV